MCRNRDARQLEQQFFITGNTEVYNSFKFNGLYFQFTIHAYIYTFNQRSLEICMRILRTIDIDSRILWMNKKIHEKFMTLVH